MNVDLLKQLSGDLEAAFTEIGSLLESGGDAEELTFLFDKHILPVAQQFQATNAAFPSSPAGLDVSACAGAADYFKGLQYLKAGDMVSAVGYFTSASQTMHYFLNYPKWKEIACTVSAIANYWEGVASIQNLDMSAGLKKLEESKRQVKNSGKYGAEMAKTIDLQQGGIFFLTGVKSAMQMDYSNGLRQMHLAAKTTKDAADKNFAADTEEYRVYVGLSLYYEAFAEFQLQMIRFNSYEFDTARDKSITGLLNDAAAYIKNSQLPEANPLIVPLMELMSSLDTALEKMSGLILERLAYSQNSPSQVFMEVRQSVLAAQDAALRVSGIMKSDLGNVWLQTCNNFSKLIGNLERFLTAKDPKAGAAQNISIETLTFDPKEVARVCKELIAQNKVADALINLNKFFANRPDQLNDVIQTQQKWADLRQRIQLNLVSEADAGVEKAKIVQAALFWADGIAQS